MNRSVVLGINAAHDAAACLVIDGQLVVALPEERLTRGKHHEGYPYRAVDYCLRAAGLRDVRDVDAIVVNEYVRTDFGLELRQAGFEGALTVNPSHHLLHAYYALVASNYSRPAVLILDGSGYSYGEYKRRGSPLLGPEPEFSEMEEAESMYSVDADGELAVVRKVWALCETWEPYLRFPSLGHMYTVASEYIFGHMQHAGKTMGLAPYGDPSYFPDPIISYGPDGHLTIDTEWITRVPPRSGEPAHLDPICRNVAAKVQAELERAVLHLCGVLHEATGADELCLSGGVGLNSVTNGLILRRTPFTKLFVTPAAGDSGVAIGAALYGHRQLVGSHASWRAYNNFHGREYTGDDIDVAVAERRRFLTTERVEDVAVAAADDIAEGLFVGWFEGPSEFGPRALGHRSILCDPRPDDMRERLNSIVKFREPFRPYAASVLTEHVGEFFDVLDDDPFMMTVAPILASKQAAIASVSHVDGTCRIQTVDADQPGQYRRLIERFYEISGFPLVLNTSFNVRGEPIVETPKDALRCFLACNLDVLYLGGLRVTKLSMPADVQSVIPCLNESVSIGSSIASRDGAALEPAYFCQTRTGHRTPISPDDYVLLQLIDAKRSMAELALALPSRRDDEVVAAVTALQRGGLVSLMAAEPDAS